MAYAKVFGVGLVGLHGHLVEIEADIAAGLPNFTITGLPDAALSEARDRVRAAVVNAGEPWPMRRITVNLLPASVPKHGSIFDLPLAAAILIAAGQLPARALREAVVLGELGLDGAVRPVRGVLPCVLAAVRLGMRRFVVPVANGSEAQLIPDVDVRSIEHLGQLIAAARSAAELPAAAAAQRPAPQSGPDLRDVAGQAVGRWALEIAAAGGHHLAMVGPPGAGKTMLAQRICSILPELKPTESLEVTAVHSVAGLLKPEHPLIRRPPFQAPHHSTSVAALVGGGSGVARPGALALAHLGVLFLDEAPEFSVRALEALRQPLEDGRVMIARAHGQVTFPAKAQLIIAANPCPCAKPAGAAACECTSYQRRRYLGRLSGPLRDRIDVRVRLDPVGAAQLQDDSGAESSELVAARVMAARAAASSRWSSLGYSTNADVPGSVLRRAPWKPSRADTEKVRHELDTGNLTARGYDRVLRIAWTISDLDGSDRPTAAAFDEAIHLRIGAGL
jgi:magnesium chelatase family protein